jgi:hypothetical protein
MTDVKNEISLSQENDNDETLHRDMAVLYKKSQQLKLDKKRINDLMKGKTERLIRLMVRHKKQYISADPMGNGQYWVLRVKKTGVSYSRGIVEQFVKKLHQELETGSILRPEEMLKMVDSFANENVEKELVCEFKEKLPKQSILTQQREEIQLFLEEHANDYVV